MPPPNQSTAGLSLSSQVCVAPRTAALAVAAGCGRYGPPTGPAYPQVQCAATHRVGERPSQGLSSEYTGNGGSNGGGHLDASDGRGRRGCFRNVGNSTRRALGV
jgi:hypothetical protein